MKLDKESLHALYFYTDQESAGTFECSNNLLDTLWNMTRRTYCNNFMSIPTDCPQREKNGWTADAYLSQEIGLLNYDSILAYEKWLDDFIDNQKESGQISGIIPTSDWGYDDWIGPVWDAAMFIIPYNLYLYYGSARPYSVNVLRTDLCPTESETGSHTRRRPLRSSLPRCSTTTTTG